MKTGLTAGVLAAFFLSLMAGKVWILPSEWFADTTDGWIFVELRLPRAILGLGIGAVLGLSGAVLQGYLRNPLADPTIIGISSSAALGGVIAISFGLAVHPSGLFFCAMAGAALSIILLTTLAGRVVGSLGFILAGMVLSTFSGSLTAFIISVSSNPFATNEIVMWLMGALTDRGVEDVLAALPFLICGSLILFSTGRSLDALTLGEDTALSLGVHIHRLQWVIVVGVGLCVGASVAVSGVIGFIGLIVPHFARSLIGEKPSAILLPSALGGALLTLLADSLVRLTPGVGEIRLGVATSILGVPFFILLMVRSRNRTL